MATMPIFFRRTQGPAPAALRIEKDPYRLRALPQEDVFFYCKKIDNSRLVREPDPKAGRACWSIIGAACLAAVALTTVGTVKVYTTMNGYKLEDLRAEERRLLDEGR